MRIQLSAKFKRCCLKNKPAMPLTFSNFSRARQAHFLSYDLQIWWKVITFKGTYVIWFWFWYLSRYGIWKNVKSCTLHLTELFDPPTYGYAKLHLIKIWLFTKFEGHSSKNEPAAPLRSLKRSRAWQAYFSCNTF